MVVGQPDAEPAFVEMPAQRWVLATQRELNRLGRAVGGGFNDVEVVGIQYQEPIGTDGSRDDLLGTARLLGLARRQAVVIVAGGAEKVPKRDK